MPVSLRADRTELCTFAEAFGYRPKTHRDWRRREAERLPLFLPLGYTKAQQRAASGGTQRTSKSEDSTSDEARSGTVRQAAAMGG